MRYTFIYSILALILSSCSTYSENELATFDTEIQSYLTKNDLNYKKSTSGLYYNILKKGEGQFIQLSDSVSFTYTGRLLDKTIFDRQKTPIKFAVKDLITGWKEIIVMNKPGAEVQLILPPNLGYGTHDLDDIPANSILIFDMTILKTY